MYDGKNILKEMGIKGGLYEAPERITFLFVETADRCTIGHCLECGFVTKNSQVSVVEENLLGFARMQLGRAYTEDDFSIVTPQRGKDYDNLNTAASEAERCDHATIAVLGVEVPILKAYHSHASTDGGGDCKFCRKYWAR